MNLAVRRQTKYEQKNINKNAKNLNVLRLLSGYYNWSVREVSLYEQSAYILCFRPEYKGKLMVVTTRSSAGEGSLSVLG